MHKGLWPLVYGGVVIIVILEETTPISIDIIMCDHWINVITHAHGITEPLRPLKQSGLHHSLSACHKCAHPLRREYREG